MARSLLERRLTQEVTLHLKTAVTEDDHGNDIYSESDQVVRGFAGEQVRTEAGGGEVVGEGLALYLQHDSPVTGWDACTIGGLRYEIVGHPWRVFNPRTAEVHHVRADIRRAGTDA